MNKLSIIIPHYNTPKLLMVLLNNLVEQQKKFPQTEIIVVDDGSIFGVGWLGRYKTVRVIKQRNQGVSSARNRGLKFAEGDYITFIDSDDNVVDDYLEKIYKEIDKGGWDYMYFKFWLCNKGEQKPCKFREQLLKNYTCWGYVYTKRCINGERFNTNLNVGEDTDWLRRVLAGKKCHFLDEFLYYYQWDANRESLCKRFRRGEIGKYKVPPAS